MGKYLLLVAASILAFLPGTALADRMNYSYLQLTGLVNTDMERAGTTVDGDGLGFRAGFIMGPYLFADGRVDSVDLDNNTDALSGSLRLGYRDDISRLHSPLRLDAYGLISLEYADIETGGTEVFNEPGFGLTGGIRFGPIEHVDVGLEYNYTDYGGSSSDYFSVEGIWNISRWFGLVIEYRSGEYDIQNAPNIDRDDLNLGLRVQFGGDEPRRFSRL